MTKTWIRNVEIKVTNVAEKVDQSLIGSDQ